MKTAVFAYSRQGCQTAKRIACALTGDIFCYTLEKFEEPDFSPLGKPSEAFYGDLFSRMDNLIFVGSCGIAVRQIAPHVKDKKTDPAVLVVDELGTYVVPVLSGHIGGANALALRLAGTLHALPVVTTATDINRKFSVDAWAARTGLTISSMALAKAVSAAILERDVPLCSDFPIVSPLPGGIIPAASGELGICISCYEKSPFARTLRLIPRCLHLGLGCRRNTPEAQIEAAVRSVLAENRIDPRSIRCAASIDLKKDEQGLLDFCTHRSLPVSFYSADQLQEVPGDFTPSAFVSKITGVDNVCERSALLGADTLIVKKTACSGVTVAVAAENWEVNFG